MRDDVYSAVRRGKACDVSLNVSVETKNASEAKGALINTSKYFKLRRQMRRRLMRSPLMTVICALLISQRWHLHIFYAREMLLNGGSSVLPKRNVNINCLCFLLLLQDFSVLQRPTKTASVSALAESRIMRHTYSTLRDDTEMQ